MRFRRENLAYLYRIQPKPELRPGSRWRRRADAFNYFYGMIFGFLSLFYVVFLTDIFGMTGLRFFQTWKIILPVSLAFVIIFVILVALPRAWINFIFGLMIVMLFGLAMIMAIEGGARYYGVTSNDYIYITNAAVGMYIGLFFLLFFFIVALIAITSNMFKRKESSESDASPVKPKDEAQ